MTGREQREVVIGRPISAGLKPNPTVYGCQATVASLSPASGVGLDRHAETVVPPNRLHRHE